jgi:hypothetical protein
MHRLLSNPIHKVHLSSPFLGSYWTLGIGEFLWKFASGAWSRNGVYLSEMDLFWWGTWDVFQFADGGYIMCRQTHIELIAPSGTPQKQRDVWSSKRVERVGCCPNIHKHTLHPKSIQTCPMENYDIWCVGQLHPHPGNPIHTLRRFPQASARTAWPSWPVEAVDALELLLIISNVESPRTDHTKMTKYIAATQFIPK